MSDDDDKVALDVESSEWTPGGIFGGAVRNILEMDELLDADEGAHPDGMGGTRPKPGYGNFLGAQDKIIQDANKIRRRQKMLVGERFIDELPEFGERIMKRYLPNLYEAVVDRVTPPHRRADELGEKAVESFSAALGHRVHDTVVEIASEIYAHAYDRELRMARAAVKLGAFGDEDDGAKEWAARKAERLAEAPTAAVRELFSRLKSAVRAFSAPVEPEPVEEVEGDDAG